MSIASALAHSLVDQRVEIPVGHGRRAHGDRYGRVTSVIKGGKVAVELDPSGKTIVLRPHDLRVVETQPA